MTPVPTKRPAEVRGLKEIPHSAWIITSGNRAYLFSGTPGEIRGAVNKVSLIPRNLGNTTHVRKVV